MYAAHRNVFEFVFVLLQMLDDLELTNTSTNTRAKLTYAHTLSWVTALVPMENGGSCLAAMHAHLHLFGQEKKEKRERWAVREQEPGAERKRKAAAVSNEWKWAEKHTCLLCWLILLLARQEPQQQQLAAATPKTLAPVDDWPTATRKSKGKPKHELAQKHRESSSISYTKNTTQPSQKEPATQHHPPKTPPNDILRWRLAK